MRKRNNLIILLIFSIVIISILDACEPIDIPLTGSIEGIITDAETNQPIQGANITLSPLNTSTTTGNDGKYSFKELDPGEFVIEVQKANYTTNSKTVSVVVDQKISGDIILFPIKPKISISLSSLDFGSNLTTLPVSITNSGEGILNWSISENANWISVNPISGSTTTQTSNIMITVDRTSISTGSHTQVVSITSNGGNATITITAIN